MAVLTGCAAGGPPRAATADAAEHSVVDLGSTACTVSYDGFIWYRIPAGAFSPIDVRRTLCDAFTLNRDFRPPRPRWAIPDGPTQARFVATSLQQKFSISGMSKIERTAERYHVPVTWMVGDLWWMGLAGFYNAYHAVNGDDAQAEFFASLHDEMKRSLPWYVPRVSIQGAGGERDLRAALGFGEGAFWGITWNSLGTDATSDRGAPWGTYCADLHSYKRPARDGTCRSVAFEWTARDLTRAYLSGREDLFSTDPDDLQHAGMSAGDAERYARDLIDAYAAAGREQPLVVVSQQESSDERNPGDPGILDAIYGQAVADGMRPETLSQAAADARRFSAQPRAVAFPYLGGGTNVPSPVLGGDALYPSTIDYHDAQTGMTFLAGHTMPTRVFRYADDPVSRFNVPLEQLPAAKMPVLTSAIVSGGRLSLALLAPEALHFGIALWSDPATLRVVRPGSIAAGRAGIVVTFDLHRGFNVVAIHCPGCRSTVFPYST
ncbi:MAG: hypothetical protein WB615_06290 [Candidatus Tumulicola sp.]